MSCHVTCVCIYIYIYIHTRNCCRQFLFQFPRAAKIISFNVALAWRPRSSRDLLPRPLPLTPPLLLLALPPLPLPLPLPLPPPLLLLALPPPPPPPPSRLQTHQEPHRRPTCQPWAVIIIHTHAHALDSL